MGKAKVRYAAFDLEDHAVSNDAKISSKSSKGSASKSWAQAKGSAQPTHKEKGQNSKLHPHVTSIEFDGNADKLTLDSQPYILDKPSLMMKHGCLFLLL